MVQHTKSTDSYVVVMTLRRAAIGRFLSVGHGLQSTRSGLLPSAKADAQRKAKQHKVSGLSDELKFFIIDC